jgi:hypothetical protein
MASSQGIQPAATVSISLTTFIAYAAASGRAKVTVVARAKTQYATEYAKERDFWLPLRHAIMLAHESGDKLATMDMDALIASVAPAKVASYLEAIAGYYKWVGRRRLNSRGQLHCDWTHGGLTVNINPELDLEMNRVRTVVKLYFNKDRLTKTRLDIALHLLRLTTPQAAAAAILDVRRGRLYSATSRIDSTLDVLLGVEADGLVKLWRTL